MAVSQTTTAWSMAELPERIWSIEESSTPGDLALISTGVIDVGRAEAIGGNPRPIACFLREGPVIVAGATGRTEFQRLFVKYLWVREDLRGSGLGRATLERIESAARVRGARDSLIETLSDRTAALYRSLGYSEMAVIPLYVGCFTKYVMVKGLD